MALTLDSCDTFARGNFNPHIINPEWLAEQKIWQPEEAELALPLGMPVRGLQFRAKGVVWIVDADRLVVSSISEDCGELVARVLIHLPHTPIIGVGNNFTFVGDRDDWGDSPVPMLGTKGPDLFPEEMKPEQARWSGTANRDGVRIDSTVVIEPDGVAVRFNFHRATRKAVAAADAARQFSNDKSLAMKLLMQLVNQEVQ